MSDLPDGWKWVSFGELVAELRNGVFVSRPGTEDTGRPILRISAVRPMSLRTDDVRYLPASATIKSEENSYLSEGDLLFTRYNGNAELVAACARVRRTVPNLLYPDKLIRVRTVPELADAAYIEAVMAAPQTRAAIRGLIKTTAGQVGISGGDLRRIPVPIAPRGEQALIVAEIEEQFSRLDAGEEGLRSAQSKARQMQAAVLGQLLQNGAGESWPSVPLATILVAGRYGTSTKCAYNGPGLPVLRIPNVQSGTISFDDIKNAVDPKVDLGAALAAEGDVLIIRTNGSRSLIGKAAVVPALKSPMAFASYLIQLRVNPELMTPAFLVAVLATPQLRLAIERYAATTAGQYNISLSKLRLLPIPLPPLDEQRRLMMQVDPQLAGIGRLERDLRHGISVSTRLRSAILSAAFSGKPSPQEGSA